MAVVAAASFALVGPDAKLDATENDDELISIHPTPTDPPPFEPPPFKPVPNTTEPDDEKNLAAAVAGGFSGSDSSDSETSETEPTAPNAPTAPSTANDGSSIDTTRGRSNAESDLADNTEADDAANNEPGTDNSELGNPELANPGQDTTSASDPSLGGAGIENTGTGKAGTDNAGTGGTGLGGTGAFDGQGDDDGPQNDEGVVFENCAEAYAAGVAPILKGEPGYATKLDRDQDGIACDLDLQFD